MKEQSNCQTFTFLFFIYNLIIIHEATTIGQISTRCSEVRSAVTISTIPNIFLSNNVPKIDSSTVTREACRTDLLFKVYILQTWTVPQFIISLHVTNHKVRIPPSNYYYYITFRHSEMKQQRKFCLIIHTI